MVESAMEFLRICKDENYLEIIISMKASNTSYIYIYIYIYIYMVQAYRLLVAEMIKKK